MKFRDIPQTHKDGIKSSLDNSASLGEMMDTLNQNFDLFGIKFSKDSATKKMYANTLFNLLNTFNPDKK